MNIEQIISINKNVWSQHLGRVSKFTSLTKGGLLFPNVLLISEVDKYFIIELLGISEKLQELKIKKNNFSSLSTYLFQFNYKKENITPSKSNTITPTSFSNILFGGNINDEILDERFNFHNKWGVRFIDTNKASIDMLKLDSCNYVDFNDSCIVNNLNNTYKLKRVNHLHIISKTVDKTDYKKFLIKRLSIPTKCFVTSELIGTLYSKSNISSAEILYSQFLNIYSFQKLRETTIGEFLNLNPLILKKAFNSDNIIYEPELDWFEGNNDDQEKSINPDFMIQRNDGYFDIFDLKLPYWGKKRLTKGKRKRRSFLQIVDEAIAQLANYEDYFNFEKNIKYAKDKYKIKVKNPRLIIVIGNYYNYDRLEIEQASRKLKDNFLILDYDSLNLKFYNGYVTSLKSPL